MIHFIVLDIDECALGVKECNNGLEENCPGNVGVTPPPHSQSQSVT